MISNNYNNNVNFTAKLDLSRVTKNKKMWNEVAQMFEEKTAKKPYTFRIDDRDNNIAIDTFNSTKVDAHEHLCLLSNEGIKKFMALTPEKKANKLAKLLDIFKRQDKTDEAAIKLLRHLEKNDKNGALFEDIRPGENSYDRILWTTQRLAEKDRNTAVAKDNIFKDATFHY